MFTEDHGESAGPRSKWDWECGRGPPRLDPCALLHALKFGDLALSASDQQSVPWKASRLVLLRSLASKTRLTLHGDVPQEPAGGGALAYAPASPPLSTRKVPNEHLQVSRLLPNATSIQ